jgi:hypothetical protein
MEATTLHLPGSLEPQFRHSVALYEMGRHYFQCCGSILFMADRNLLMGRWREALDANGETRRFPMAKFKAQGLSRKTKVWKGAGKKRKWAPV